MKKYELGTLIHKVSCKKCGAELYNEEPKPREVVVNGVLVPMVMTLPIDYLIDGENKVGFHCNTCCNEDDFEIFRF